MDQSKLFQQVSNCFNKIIDYYLPAVLFLVAGETVAEITLPGKGTGVDILIDFLNMEPNVTALRAVLTRSKELLRSLNPDDQFELLPDIIDRGDSDLRFVTLKRKEFEKSYPLSAKQCSLCICSDDERFSEIWSYMKEEQNDYKLFIDKCKNGIVHREFLETLFYYSFYQSPKLVQTDNPWAFRISAGKPCPECFEGYIAVDIINDFLEGRGEGYKRVRTCMNCGKYTAGRSTKRAFCSITCRNQLHYKTRKNR